jgi:non-heme chloroperoxidase
MPFLSHAGVSLRYDRAGSGPAVIFVHGWLCNRTFWERQVVALRDRFTVVTVDLRGHGESSRPRAGYGMSQLAADLEHLVRALGVPRVALVGWSMGGVVAMELARKLGEKVSALGLVGTTAGALTDPENPHAEAKLAAEIQAAVKADVRVFTRQLGAMVFKEGTAHPLCTWAISQLQKTPQHVAEASLAGLYAADLRSQLKTLKVPTAVLHGRHDAILSFAGGEYLAKHIPGARLVAFEQSGHAPHLEEPDAFNAALVELIGGQA